MICYRDRTFCRGDGCKKFDTCPRALTQEIKDRAKKAGFLIAQFTKPKKLECYEPDTKN